MSETKIYFSTNRMPKENFDVNNTFYNKFNDFGPHELRFGSVTVNENGLKEAILAAENFDENRLGSIEIFEKIREEMTGRCDTLIYIHGYNNSFEDAANSAYKLSQNLAENNLIFGLFAWPSKASLRKYLSDREHAESSRTALKRALIKLLDFLRKIQACNCGRKIHILCHSMGAYVLRHAIQEAKRDIVGRFPKIFDQIILAAADEDYDCLDDDSKLSDLLDICQRITIYHNENDRALWASDAFKGNPERLGASGPKRNNFSISKVHVVNCTSRKLQGGNNGHSYHLDDPVVAKDISDVIKGKTASEINTRTFVPSEQKFFLKFH